MSDETITFLVLGVVVAVFVWDHLPVAAVALGTALSLWATGVLSLEQSLAGFGDPTVIFIASLFVVSEALDATGVTSWAGQELIDRAGESRTRVVVLMLLLVALLTALISVNGSVAALLPIGAVMMALCVAAAASFLTPVATPANLMVMEPGGYRFGDYWKLGLPLMALFGVVAVLLVPLIWGF